MASGGFENVSRITRRGDSLWLRIPQKCVDQLELQDGQSVSVRVERNSLVVNRVKARKKCTEEELLNGITPEMCGPDLIPDRLGKELL